MSLSSRFNKDLCKQLNRNLKSPQWCTEFRIGGPTRERVDVARKPGKRGPTILVEAELKREDPASNVLKVWNRHEAGAYPSGVVLIQGFSHAFSSKKHQIRSVRYETAKRLGNMIEENSAGKFKYICIDIPYRPRAGSKEGDGARKNWAEWFGKQVASKCRGLGIKG